MARKYEADDFKVLSDVEQTRLRPGRVVGGANETGLRVILKEILDNSFDECLAKHASNVRLTLDADGRGATIADDGRGIPLEKNPTSKLSTLATAFANSRAGSKFESKAYGVSVGLHGEGASATNFLSETFTATSYRGRQKGTVEFKRGKIIGKDATVSKNDTSIRHGTVVHFRPDFEQIFKDVPVYNADQIKSSLEDTALLLPGVAIEFQVAPDAQVEVFDNSAGLAGLLGKYAGSALRFEPMVRTVDFKVATRESNDPVPAHAEVAFGWRKEDAQTTVRSYTNLSFNSAGGTHQAGFERAVASYFVEPAGGKCGAREIMEGFVGIIHVKHPAPEFDSQTKERLINKELAKQIQEAVEPAIKTWVRSHAAEVDVWLAECVELHEYRKKEKDDRAALKDLKSGQRKRGIMPTKLYEANCHPDDRELFICEGDSAASGLAEGRDASYQEVLPLRGKILNALKASLAECLKNNEIQAIVAAIGGGLGDDFDLSACRASKVLIISDADCDGLHINSLVMALMVRFMPALLKSGRVYIVDAPLFMAAKPASQTRYYGHTMEELKKKAGKDFSKCEITRLKGHGQANANEVAEYAMNPATRKLIQIQCTDKDFDQIRLLMSEDVEARKELLGV